MHSKESRAALGAPANVHSHPDPEFYDVPTRKLAEVSNYGVGAVPLAYPATDRLPTEPSGTWAELEDARVLARSVPLADPPKEDATADILKRVVVLAQCIASLSARITILEATREVHEPDDNPVVTDINLGQPTGDYAGLTHASADVDLKQAGFVYLNAQGLDLLGQPLITAPVEQWP